MARPNGPLVRELRTDNGWTQQKLARRIHRTHPLISRIESGRPVSEAVMEQVAKVFKVGLSEITLPLESQSEAAHEPLRAAS
jgi:transcriptional regulator with XRE-family HTH domain